MPNDLVIQKLDAMEAGFNEKLGKLDAGVAKLWEVAAETKAAVAQNKLDTSLDVHELKLDFVTKFEKVEAEKGVYKLLAAMGVKSAAVVVSIITVCVTLWNIIKHIS